MRMSVKGLVPFWVAAQTIPVAAHCDLLMAGLGNSCSLVASLLAFENDAEWGNQ